MTHQLAHVTATCPRCGYDLQGPIDTWKDCCPLHGKCTECGYEFAWRNILNPAMNVYRWHLETALDWIPIALLRTLVRMLMPWRFWRLLRLEAPVRPHRIAMLIIPALVMMYVGSILAVGYHHAAPRWQVNRVQEMWFWIKKEAFDPPPDHTFQFTTYGVKQTWIRARRTNLTRMIANPGTSIAFPTVIMAMTVPLCPLCYLMLPASLRAARVRKAHLIRIAAYSMFLFAWPLLELASLGGFMSDKSYYPPAVWGIRGVLCASFVWLFLWWACATHFYLKLPRAWLVAASMLTLSTLSACFLFLFYDYVSDLIAL